MLPDCQPSIIRQFENARLFPNRVPVTNSHADSIVEEASRRGWSKKRKDGKKKRSHDARPNSIWQREPKPTASPSLHHGSPISTSTSSDASANHSIRHGATWRFYLDASWAPVLRRFPWDAITSPCLPWMIAPSRSGLHTLRHPAASLDRWDLPPGRQHGVDGVQAASSPRRNHPCATQHGSQDTSKPVCFEWQSPRSPGTEELALQSNDITSCCLIS